MQAHPKRKERIYTLICATLAFILLSLNWTLLPVALPTIQEEYNMSSTLVHWIINGYTLACAAFVMSGGRLIDIFGGRFVFCLGMSIFALFAFLGGIADQGWMLIVSRTLQGVGGSMIGPATLSLFFDRFNTHERGRYLSVTATISGVFLAMGPFIGGFLTEYLSWRLIFLLKVPFALIALLIALLALEKGVKQNRPFDWKGSLALAMGVIFLIFGLMEVPQLSWSQPLLYSFFFLSFLSFLYLKGHVRRHFDPIIDFSMFRNRNFLGGSLIIFLAQFTATGIIFWPFFFQKVGFFSPFVAGLLTASATVTTTFLAPINGVLVDRFGAKYPVVIGLLISAIGFLAITLVSYDLRFSVLVAPLLIYGIGRTSVFMPISLATLNNIDAKVRGMANGIFRTMRFSGGAFGVALLSILIHQTHDWKFKENLSPTQIDGQPYISLLEKTKNLSTTLVELPSQTRDVIVRAWINASETAFAGMNLTLAIASLCGFMIALRFLKR